MTAPDHEAERARLAGVYSAMSDEELRTIAESGDELSVAAQDALLAEASKRGFPLTITPLPVEEAVEFSNLVTLRQYRDLPVALLAKGSLDSAGIETFLVDDNMIRMDWFISNLLGGIKLKVRAEDAQAANEILNQPIPEMVEVEGVGEYEQPKCPSVSRWMSVFWNSTKYGPATLAATNGKTRLRRPKANQAQLRSTVRIGHL